MGAQEVLSIPFCSNPVDNTEYSDTQLVHAVRKALASVQNGDTDHYTQLIGMMMYPKYSDFDSVVQLETLLKALSGSVACIDVVHHRDLLSTIFTMSLWDHRPNVMDALVDLIISLAVTSGKYLDLCLNMLVSNFFPPPSVTDEKKQEVRLRVHEALHKISYLIPLAPSKLAPILAQRMPKIHIKDQDSLIVTWTYVDNLLKLESSPIGKVVGSMIFMVVMERLRDLDLESGSDDILQDDSNIGMFDMELEYAVESTMNEGDEVIFAIYAEFPNMTLYSNDRELLDYKFPLGALYQNASHGNVVSDLLDKLMDLAFEHLNFCHNTGRLDEVFEILFESFENYILNTCKTKFSQFLMFYACSLDPENCGVKFASKLLEIYLSSNKTRLNRMSAVSYLASYLSRGKFLPPSFVATMLKRLVDECAEYCRTCNDGMKPKAHQVFYSGCQAILYVLCFRMRSILDIPRFQSLLTPLESTLCHKLNPLMVCHPSVVSEFLKQAKAGGLFVVSEAFNFNDLQESELSRAFGSFERLEPFSPYLLKMSSRLEDLISRHFNVWSMPKTTCDEDDEVIVNEDGETEEDWDDEDELDKEMSTPKYSFMRDTERLLKMPSRIIPSTSPPESFLM